MLSLGVYLCLYKVQLINLLPQGCSSFRNPVLITSREELVVTGESLENPMVLESGAVFRITSEGNQ